jgi:hypothetical protein
MLDSILEEKLDIYFLGGTVMAINGLKVGTKDIDVIVEHRKDHRNLISSLEKCGYLLLQPQDLSKPYVELSATALQNREGFRWEIFVEYVAKKLVLTSTVRKRATEIYSGDRLTVFRLSNEDLFLMKAMTERDRDLEDMSILARSGLDYGIILHECISQSKMDPRGNVWESSLYEKCLELKKVYGIEVPFLKELEKISIRKMMSNKRKRH